MSLLVDTPPSCAAGQLGELTGCQHLVRLACELGEFLNDH